MQLQNEDEPELPLTVHQYTDIKIAAQRLGLAYRSIRFPPVCRSLRVGEKIVDKQLECSAVWC